jgi:serine/threonine protein kinase
MESHSYADDGSSTSGSSHSHHPKKQIGDYELKHKLGNGAYGWVYEAIDKETGQIVAIKCVDKDKIVKLDKTRHVFREKNILSTLDHPYIIKLLNTCQVTK